MKKMGTKGKTTAFYAAVLSLVLVISAVLAFSGVIAAPPREAPQSTGDILPMAMPDIIVDNPAATFVGSWPTSSYYAGYYGANYQWNSAGAGSDVCTWWFTIPTSGTYYVYAWWAAASNKASNAPFSIYTGIGTTTIAKDQRVNGGSWQLLAGPISFTAGSRYVRLTDNANGEVVADAIKVVEYVPAPKYYLSVPFAAFQPPNGDDKIIYQGSNYGLRNGETYNFLYCFAPVNLPHGATVKSVTFYFYDNGADNYFDFYMDRVGKASDYNQMVAVSNTPGSATPGWSSITDSTISYSVIDNQNYAYVLGIYLPTPSANYGFKFASIEYTPP